MKKIKNKAEFEVKFCGRTHVVETEESVVEVIKVEIEQESPCRFVLEKEKVKYVFKIKNKTDTNICDCKFKDILSERVEYVHGSFEINGRKAHHVHVRGNVLEAPIRELKACETITVSFEVKVREFEDECRHRPECHCEECCCDERGERRRGPREGSHVHASEI